MAKQSRACILFIVSLIVYLIPHFQLPIVEPTNVGFSVDLVHRDSKKSPLYNSSISHFERLRKAFDRSLSRVAYLSHAHQTSSPFVAIGSTVTPSAGEYIMNVSIGTPPVDILGIADTGSDLTWTQCNPCVSCYKQDAPLFEPNKTSTYQQLSCDSKQCVAYRGSSCDNNIKCHYEVQYGDRSHTIGDLATDTFTFVSTSGGSISIQGVAFGCGHDNGGTFNETASGIVGLGGGSLSIVNQFSDTISRKFSYCLVPITAQTNVSSKISFGVDVIAPGSGAVSTPLIKRIPDTFYFINLETISVENKTIPYKTSVVQLLQKGNMIIDSGTTLTLLSSEPFEGLVSLLMESIKATPVRDPQGDFSLCYEKNGDIELPSIVFHFTDADVNLPPSNTFVEVEEGLICLAMVADQNSIFGNLSQQNFLIEYDLENQKLSFLPKDCTKE